MCLRFKPANIVHAIIENPWKLVRPLCFFIPFYSAGVCLSLREITVTAEWYSCSYFCKAFITELCKKSSCAKIQDGTITLQTLSTNNQLCFNKRMYFFRKIVLVFNPKTFQTSLLGDKLQHCKAKLYLKSSRSKHCVGWDVRKANRNGYCFCNFNIHNEYIST